MASVASTDEVLRHHIEAFLKAATEGVAAVPEILTDYTEDSVHISPNGVLRGLDQIKAFLEGFISSVPPELISSIELIRQEIHDEVAYIAWKSEPFIPMGTDTFLIRDGKILTQTFAAHMPG